MSTIEETWWERRGDLLVTILFASVTLLVAWSGFQAAKWSGMQSINFSAASTARSNANALNNLGATATATDVAVFVAWLETSGTDLASDDVAAVTTDGGLPTFLYQSFPDRLQVAVDEWLDESPDTRTLPFDLDSYVIEEFVEAESLRGEAADLSTEAIENNQQSDIYVLTTVVLTSALFLVGICQKLSELSAQRNVFILAACVVVAGAIVLLTQPIEIALSDFGIS